MTRIAVGGFLHETNTFAPTKASYDAFVHGGGFPRMELGDSMLKNVRRINVGLAGFIEAAEAEGWDLVPTIFAAATPSAHVTEDAYERIAKVMIDGLAAAGPLDGVYLDLHGAMVAEHLDDGEGEILARVRKVIGKDVPLVVEPRSARQCHAGNGRACRCVDRLSHLSPCRHGRHRARLRKTPRAAAEDEAATCKSVPANPVPDSDQLAMHQRSAGEGHLPEGGRARERDRADPLLCIRLSGRRFRPLRPERFCLWQDAGRCGQSGRCDRRAGRKP